MKFLPRNWKIQHVFEWPWYAFNIISDFGLSMECLLSKTTRKCSAQLNALSRHWFKSNANYHSWTEIADLSKKRKRKKKKKLLQLIWNKLTTQPPTDLKLIISSPWLLYMSAWKHTQLFIAKIYDCKSLKGKKNKTGTL